MFTVEKVNRRNEKKIVDYLKSDASFLNGNPKGYILTYTGTDVLSVVLECDFDSAETLIRYAPRDSFIIHASPDLIPTIHKKFPSEKHYIENWMLVNKDKVNFFRSILTRQLGVDDASSLANMLSSQKGRPKRGVKRYVDWISKMPLYGVFVNGELVSYAGSFVQLSEIWMIGGVYTEPTHRNKGYATLAVSAITEHALKEAETAALFVRSDNYTAIRVYEKLGYRKIGAKLWVDIGTGLKP
jgi:GNAT superfamily N-acetyltransferase